MITFLKKFIGGDETDLKKLYTDGAVIIDVRMPDEYREGHIKGSINVPLPNLSREIGILKKKNSPVITCCLSGGRSSVARKMLAEKGIEAYNGGGWRNLQSKIS